MIKEDVKKFIQFLVNTLKDKINEYVSERAKKRMAEAEESARSAKKRAESADSQSEREKWEAVAAVWRDVANKFREENEALKMRIEELAAEANTEAKEAIDGMRVEADVSGEQLFLTGCDHVHKLPSPKSYSRKMSLAAESFTENVERFCDWAEGDAHTLIEGRQHLITLMSSIPSIDEFRDTGSDEGDFPRRGHDGWKEDHRRFADLPFQYYRSVFDPHDFESTDEPVTGDLHDDFADIYGDLCHGLQAHRSGHTRGALAHWVDSYFYHWGHHASSALKAIDEFYRANRNGSEQDGGGQPATRSASS